MSFVVLRYQMPPLIGFEVAPELLAMGRVGVNRTHPYLAHGLLGIIQKTLDVDQKAGCGKPNYPRPRDGEELVGKGIGHPGELRGQLWVGKHDLIPQFLRDYPGCVGNMKDQTTLRSILRIASAWALLDQTVRHTSIVL